MHIGDSTNYLPENLLTCRLWEPLVWLFLYVMINAHALAKLHDEVNMSSLVNYLMQLHQIWMPQICKGLNLTMDCIG